MNYARTSILPATPLQTRIKHSLVWIFVADICMQLERTCPASSQSMPSSKSCIKVARKDGYISSGNKFLHTTTKGR